MKEVWVPKIRFRLQNSRFREDGRGLATRDPVGCTNSAGGRKSPICSWIAFVQPHALDVLFGLAHRNRARTGRAS